MDQRRGRQINIESTPVRFDILYPGICPDVIISKYKGVVSVTLYSDRYDPNTTTRKNVIGN